MVGKTKVLSRLAGIINVVAAFFLVITVFAYFTIGNLGVGASNSVSDESSESGQESSNETDGSSDTSVGEAIVGAIGTGFGMGLGVVLLVLIMMLLLIPIGFIDVVSGLIIGSHCFKRAPRRGTVIYSLVLKVLTVPAYAFAIILIFAIGDILNAPVSPIFPALFITYIIAIVVAHVFEWMANASSRRDAASFNESKDSYEAE